jgi:short-chain fatty acids transporter
MVKAEAQQRGSFLWRFSKKFQFAADKIIPDSYVFCVILTFLTFILALILTKTGPVKLVKFWYDGLWTQIAFAFQMTLMVTLASAAAKSPQIERGLSKLARLPKSPGVAYIFFIVVVTFASWLNWAFGTILSPILAMYLSKNVKKLHFPLLITVGYACMVMIQPICPSISAVALLATPGHFLEKKIGVLPWTTTAFNPAGVAVVITLIATTIIITLMTRPSSDEIVEFEGDIEPQVEKEEKVEKSTVADWMNGSRILMYILGLGAITYIVFHFATKGVNDLNLNFIIFIFLTIDIFLYGSPLKFVKAVKDNVVHAAAILIQFPFYGGIMGMMASSGLTLVLSNALLSVSSTRTFYMLSYWSASFINLFVPSQGGQWMVQGPVLVDAAQKLGVHIPTVVSAFMLGDEATNLIQPLYIIPALALVDMKLKNAWGLMAFIWFMWFIVTSIGLVVFPMIL